MILNDSSGIIDSCPGYGWPHTAHPVVKVCKDKDLALIILINVFGLSSLHVLSTWAIILLHFLLTDNRLMRWS